MFRKGTVTFFDNDLGKGLIELHDNHQQVAFKLEDFSNQLLLPQIGERIKCIVLEQYGELFAKFIVRLDHKNYVSDQNNLSISHLYSENAYEHIRDVRQIFKKRRGTAKEDLLNPQTKTQVEQAVLADTIPDIDLVIADQHVMVVEPIPTIISNPMLEESGGDLNQANQIESLAQTQVDLSVKVIQNTELKDETHTINNIKPIEAAHAETLVVSDELLQNIEITGSYKNQALVKLIDDAQSFKGDDLYFNSQIDQLLLEKHMHLTALQRLIQKLKVKFLYSKRKQTVKKIRPEKRMTLNPWVMIVAVVIFIAVSSVMYAMDRYKQYKVEAEMRLQQYQQEQKEKIKQQKRKAYSH